jgi:hypothetical protein
MWRGAGIVEETVWTGQLERGADDQLVIKGTWKSETQTVKKRHFLRHLHIKCIILPRQARDKHRENSQQSGVCLGHVRSALGQPAHGAEARARCEKWSPPFPLTFPMFVSRLSWQNDRFSCINCSKRGVFRRMDLPGAGGGRA